MSSGKAFALLAGRSGEEMAQRISASLERICKRRQAELEGDNSRRFIRENEWKFVNYAISEGWYKVGATCTTSYADGEIKPRIHRDTNLRGRDVFVVQNSFDPRPGNNTSENILEMLLLVDTIKRSEADTVTLILPYHSYCKQDKPKGKEPISSEVMFRLYAAVGVNRIVTFDLHSDQELGFCSPTVMKIENLFAAPVILNSLDSYFSRGVLSVEKTKIVSPDLGNSGMAEHYAKMLGLEVAVCRKKRSTTTAHSLDSMTFEGGVEGYDIIMPDDQVASGGTVETAAKLLKKEGAGRVYVTATHGLFIKDAEQRFRALKAGGFIDEVVVTDTITHMPDFLKRNQDFLKIISLADFAAMAAYQIHVSGSVSELYEPRLREGLFP